MPLNRLRKYLRGMKKGAKTIDRDLGFSRIIKELDTLKGSEIVVGWQGTPIAEYMLYNEKGTDTIPPRPVMADTHDKKRPLYMQQLISGQRDVYAGKLTARQLLNEIGVQARGDLQVAIQQWDTPPNAPSTIEKKGKDNPLIDFGHAMQAVNYDVRRRTK